MGLKPSEARVKTESERPEQPKVRATPPKPKPSTFERPPEIIGLRTLEQIKERALEGRAAKCYPQSYQIFINPTCPVVPEMISALLAETELPRGSHEEEARCIATDTAEWALTKCISRAVAYSLSKRSLGWRPEEVTRSQSTESLSLVADDCAVAMDMARARYQDQLAATLPVLVAPLPVAV